jgi:DNA-binding beta-propeller fold protein YncE
VSPPHTGCLPSSRGARTRHLVALLVGVPLLSFLSACEDAPAPEPAETGEAPAAAERYEVWAIDQGTHIAHIFDQDLQEVATIDLGAEGVEVPHMLEFTSDYRYAFVAAPATGNVAVIRTEDREVVAVIPTGPRTHHAAVAPDDRSVLVSVIGAAGEAWDGRIVEIEVELEAESFTPGRELFVAQDPLFATRADEFLETGGAVCMAFTEDGTHGYVTLGPGLEEGGAVVLDLGSFSLTRVFPPGEVAANCGTILAPDGRHMYLVGGDREVGVWHAMDTNSHEHVHQAGSMGHDAHGSWVTPDGSEYWLVNRVTSNAIVVDPATLEVIDEIPFVGKTPDIVAMSPDGRYAFITLRGPHPVTMPHVAVGETPGFAVIEVASREMVRLVEPAQGNDASDFHAIAVRPLE